MLVFGPQKVEVSQRGGESHQHGDDGNKKTGSVSDILFKHDACCLRTNLELSAELLNEIKVKIAHSIAV